MASGNKKVTGVVFESNASRKWIDCPRHLFLAQEIYWAFHARQGLAEMSENVPEEVDATIELPFWTFAEVLTGDTTLAKQIESGTAKVEGSQEALTEVIGSFDKVAKDEVNPGRLHN